TIIGAIPLLINNALVTGNHLVPAFYVYEKKILAGASGEEIIGAGEAVNGVVQSVPAPPGGISGFLSVLANHFSPSWSTLPGDIFGILFAPASGNMSLVAISPLIVLAIILLPVIYLDWRRGERPQNLAVVAFLAVIACAVWVAYIRSLPGLNASHGIVPDIRYLAPFYLPAGLLGVYAISRFNGEYNPRKRTLLQMVVLVVSAPVLLIVMMLIYPTGAQYADYVVFFARIVFVLLAVTLALIAARKRFEIPHAWIAAAMLLLIAVPFAWQLMMVFLYSAAKFNGYPLWIPLVETFYEHFIVVSAPNSP
ncbi:MAG: hypothetical protein KO254_11105, partial [Methanoculleus marisnigri]|nr:hypothetical protein [Methanoculleus marisnigri]